MHLVNKAATAPNAARTGANNTPTAPAVRGNSNISSPFSFLIIILRALPSSIISFTFSTILSPEIVNSYFFATINFFSPQFFILIDTFIIYHFTCLNSTKVLFSFLLKKFFNGTCNNKTYNTGKKSGSTLH